MMRCFCDRCGAAMTMLDMRPLLAGESVPRAPSRFVVHAIAPSNDLCHACIRQLIAATAPQVKAKVARKNLQ